MRPLSPMQRAFVDAYNGDATAAAIAAGYAERSAKQQGHVLIHDERVLAAIRQRDEARQKATAEAHVQAGPILGRLELQAFWTRVALGQETETVVTKDGEPIDVPPPMSARLKATELLGRSMALFTDKIEHGADSSFADVLKAARERSARR